MNVLVTGPESSGTRYVTDILTEAGLDVLHQSMPEGDYWWPLVFAYDFDARIVVVRGRHAHLSSLILRGICTSWESADEKRRLALQQLAPLLADRRTLLVTYESLANAGEVRSLLCELGVDGARWTPTLKTLFTDENLKHSWPAEGFRRPKART